MGLECCKVEAIVAVSDMDKAKGFYEGKLGLPAGPEEGDGGITYRCAGRTAIHVYASPEPRMKTPDASSPVVKSDRFHPALASA